MLGALLLRVVVAALLLPTIVSAQKSTKIDPAVPEQIKRNISQMLPEIGGALLPGGLIFTENRGQVIDTRGDRRPDILYTAMGGGMRLYFRPTGISYLFSAIERRNPKLPLVTAAAAAGRVPTAQDSAVDGPMLTVRRMDLELIGANPRPQVTSEEKAPGHRNYYLAHCPEGITDVESFGKIVYHDVYPGVDMVMQGGKRGLKYDFVINPGGDPSAIRLRYVGADKVSRTRDGGIRIANPLGTVREGAPYTYQRVSGSDGDAPGAETSVTCRYIVEGNEVRFSVGGYDRSRVLVIDPDVEWATYLGGDSTEMFGGEAAVTVDGAGNVAVTGISMNHVNFPANGMNVFQKTVNGMRDAFLLKMDPSRNYLWCTFLGGSKDEDAGSVAAEPDKNDYVVCGWTASDADFPKQGGFQTMYGGGASDAYMGVFDNANGSRKWLGYYGGQLDDRALSVKVLDKTSMVICGVTSSTNFPRKNPLFNTLNGTCDGFILRGAVDGSLVTLSSFYGGADNDTCTAVAADADGNMYFAGITLSSDMPFPSGGLTPYGGKQDGFLFKLAPDNTVSWGTYFGGSDTDMVRSVAVDVENRVVICGSSLSDNVPTTGNEFTAFQPARAAQFDMVIASFTPEGVIRWATYYGGSSAAGKPADYGYDVDCSSPSGDVFVTGWTFCTNFPVITPTFQQSLVGASDAVVVRLDSNGKREWATYYGGDVDDHGYSIAVSQTENAYVAGATTSGFLPRRETGVSISLHGHDDAFLVKFRAPCYTVGPALEADVPPKLCQGDIVELKARPGNYTYQWSPTGETSATIQARASGIYKVTITDPEGCTDEAEITLNFLKKSTPVINGPRDFCQGDSVQWDATSQAYVKYQWIKDGVPIAGATFPRVWLKEAGTYSVQVIDTNGCAGNVPNVRLDVYPLPAVPKIVAENPSGDTVWICPGTTAPVSVDKDYYSYRWSNGDSTKNANLTGPGVFRVTVTNENGCKAVSAPIYVRLLKKPAPVVNALGPTEICLGDSVTIEATDPMAAEFVWSNGMRGKRITVKEKGVYRVTSITSENCSAFSQNTVAVTIRPGPNGAIDGPEATCGDATATYRAPNVADVQYQWSLQGSGTIVGPSNGNTLKIKWGPTGSGVITLRAIDLNTGCITESKRTVTLGSELKPVIMVGGPTTFCIGDSLVLGAGSGYRTYQWSTGDTTEYIIVRDAGEYSVKVVDSGGCAGTSAPVKVGVTVRPTPVITGPEKVCIGSTTQYSAELVPGNVYRWKVQGGVILGGDGTYAISVKWGTAGVGTVDMTQTSGGICEAAAPRQQVTIGSQLEPVIAASGKLNFCQGDSVTLDAGDGYATYKWTNGATSRTIVVRASGKFRVAVTDIGGCGGTSKEVAVTVSPLPVVSITANGATSFCSGDSVLLDAGAGFATYKWTTGATTRTIYAKQTGVYGVTVTNAAGCATSAVPLAVNVTPRPTPLITGAIKVCRNSTLDYSTPAFAGNTYVWAVTGGTLMSGQGTPTISVQWGNGPTGTVDLEETSADGRCTTTARQNVVDIGSVLEPVIAASRSLDLCPGDSVELDGGSGFATYLWSTGEKTRTIIARAAGDYSVTVADAGGCSGSSKPVSVAVHPNPVPVITPGGSTTVRSGDSLKLDGGAGYASYLWSTGETSQTIMVRQGGDYTVTVVDQFGCSGTSASVRVTIDIKKPVLPMAAVVELPVIEAVPGERVVVPLRLKSIVNLPETGSISYSAKLRYHAALLLPVGSTPAGVITGTDRVIQISGTVSNGTTGGDLASLEFVAALADTVSTKLVVEDFRWSDTTATITLTPGEFHLNGLCVVGSTRLVGASAGAGLKPVRPNPAGGRAEIEYTLQENGRTQIVITDMLGHQVGVILDGDAAPGRYVTGIDASALPTGLYMITLQTPTVRTSRVMEVKR